MGESQFYGFSFIQISKGKLIRPHLAERNNLIFFCSIWFLRRKEPDGWIDVYLDEHNYRVHVDLFL